MTLPPQLIALLPFTTRPAAPQVRALLEQMQPGNLYRALVVEVLGRLAPRASPAAVYRPSLPVPAPAPPGSSVGRAETPVRPPTSLAPQTPQLPRVPVTDDLGSIARLRVGNTELTAHSQRPLAVGDRLQLQVTRTEPVVELRVLEAPPRTPVRELLIHAALPRQVPPRELFQVLRALPTPPGQATRAGPDDWLPPASRPLIARIAARPTPLTEISAATVRHSVNTSGLFLERGLAAGQIPAPDLKLDLLRLMRVLQPSETRPVTATDKAAAPPPDAGRPSPAEGQGLIDRLLRLLDGSVARVQLQQAASVPAESGARQAWQAEIPVLAGDQIEQVQVRIEREPDPDGPQDAAGAGTEWRVALHFDFDSVGAIDVSVRLRGETVSTLFCCERSHTERLVGARLATLESALRAAGLEIGRVTARHGAATDPVGLPRPDAGMLDTHA